MIAGGMSCLSIATCFCVVHIIFPFSDLRIGPNMSSAIKMSCSVTRAVWYHVLVYVRSLVKGLPMMFEVALKYSLMVYLLVLSCTVVISTHCC